MSNENQRQADICRAVRQKFVGHARKVHGLWLREVEGALDSRIQENTVQIRMCVRNIQRKLWDLVQELDAKLDGFYMGLTMLLNEGIQPVLSSSDYDHFLAVLDEILGVSFTDA
jgi:hypothetical protein